MPFVFGGPGKTTKRASLASEWVVAGFTFVAVASAGGFQVFEIALTVAELVFFATDCVLLVSENVSRVSEVVTAISEIVTKATEM